MTLFNVGETIQFDWSDGICEGGIIGFYRVEKDFIDDDVLANYEGEPHGSEFIKYLVDNGYVSELVAEHNWCPEGRGELYEATY